MEIFDSFSTNIWHPEYKNLYTDWKKWRLAYYGGRVFIDEYLNKFSSRETNEDFALRSRSTYLPAFAKSGIKRIKNRIAKHLKSVIRRSSSSSYNRACSGELGGVDNAGSTMRYFMSNEVLPELLVMGKVAVCIDMPQTNAQDLYSQMGLRPYVYKFTREQMVNWKYDSKGYLESILLKEYIYKENEKFDMPSQLVTRYRYYKKEDGKVTCQILDTELNTIDTINLNLKNIPIVVFSLSGSLMEDVADYQIALLNVASSDISYAIKSNYPFYVEMYDMMAEASIDNLQRGYEETDENGNSIAGTEAVANKALNKEITTGTTKGRRVPKGLEFPKFINPSPDPLKVSIEKQEQMKKEIEELLTLSLEDLKSGSSSVDQDDSGYSQIGLELAIGELKLVKLWQEYENNFDEPVIIYPEDFQPAPLAQRVSDADALIELIPKIPSNTYRREMAKKVVSILLGDSIGLESMANIEKEIDSSPAVVPDVKTISSNVTDGILSTELACSLMGYPKGTDIVAQEEHSARLARIAAAQGGPNTAPMGARGVGDLSGNPKVEANQEKAKTQDTQTSDTSKRKTRGEAK